MTSYALEIQMTSDWHVGSGAGAGTHVDRALRRDHDGLIYVPARTLLGMWRDAAEALAATLDRLRPGPPAWAEVVDFVFGSQPASGAPLRETRRRPIPSRLSLTPARLPRDLRRVLVRSPALERATTFLSPSVKIDPTTGAAEEDFLFVSELAREGATLRAEASLDLDDAPEELRRDVLWFATASAEGIHTLGGKRRRGRGRCRVRLLGEPDATDAMKGRDEAPRAPQLPGPRPRPHAPPLSDTASEDAPWTTWRLTLELLEPLLVQSRVEGNVVLGCDHLPGSVLLAALAGDLRAAGGDPSSAIARSDLLVLHGRPELDGLRSLPAPLCWEVPKTHRVAAKLDVRSRLEEDAEEPPHAQPKPLREGYVAEPEDGTSVYGETPFTARTHGVIEDGPQRPTPDVGGVFTYRAIQPGTRLVAEVRARGEALVDAVRGVLDGWSDSERRLGRARRADYGLTRLEVVEVPSPPPDGEARVVSDTLVLFLASPLLLRGCDLGPGLRPADVERTVRRALGVADDGPTLDASASWVRAFRWASWHRSWSLARPPLVGLKAGSVLVFRNAGSVALAERRRLALEGLGERRPEGYGEVGVDVPWLAARDAPRHLQKSGAPCQDPAPPGPEALEVLRPTEFGKHLLRIAAETAMDRAIEEDVATEGTSASEAWRLRGPVTAAQIGNLRTALAAEGDANGVARVLREWLDRQRQQRERREGGASHPSALEAHMEQVVLRALEGEEGQIVQELLSEEARKHVIGFEDEVRRRSRRFVQHLLLFRCQEALRARTPHAAERRGQSHGA